MKTITVDPVARTAQVQSGATAGELIEAAEKYGLATTTGTVSSVGMTGLTLGGGYGSLIGAYGLAADLSTGQKLAECERKGLHKDA